MSVDFYNGRDARGAERTATSNKANGVQIMGDGRKRMGWRCQKNLIV